MIDITLADINHAINTLGLNSWKEDKLRDLLARQSQEKYTNHFTAQCIVKAAERVLAARFPHAEVAEQTEQSEEPPATI